MHFLLNILLAYFLAALNCAGVPTITEIEEQNDMENAFKLSNTFFWRNMVALWQCSDEKIAFKKWHIRRKKKEEILQLCEEWQTKAIAVNAYVRYTAYKAGKLERCQPKYDFQEPKSAEDIELECLSVRPKFMVDHRGELLLSSAMQPIMNVYRALFRQGLDQPNEIKMNFENANAWNIVDRWVQKFNDAPLSAEKGRIREMLQMAKIQIDADPYFMANVHGQNFYEFLNHPPQRNAQKWNLNIINMMHDVLYEEILENGESRNYLEELQIITEEFRKYLQNPDPNSINMEQLEVGNAIYQMLWDSAQEIGLGIGPICSAGLAFSKDFKNANSSSILKRFHAAMSKAKWGKLWHKLSPGNEIREASLQLMEQSVGIMFWTYRHRVYEPCKMIGYPLESIPDPCEEMKLKFKRVVI